MRRVDRNDRTRLALQSAFVSEGDDARQRAVRTAYRRARGKSTMNASPARLNRFVATQIGPMTVDIEGRVMPLRFKGLPMEPILPTTWWSDPARCHALANYFSRHLIGLHLVAKVKGNVQQALFTGFFLYHRKRVMWATAGHVIDHLAELRSSSDVEIQVTRWLDGYDHPDAYFVVDDLSTMILYRAGSGLDFGVASLDRAFMTLEANQELQPFIQKAWSGQEDANPEGYYLLGYPEVWWQRDSGVRITPKNVFVDLRAELACVPLERIDPNNSAEASDNRDFWTHPRHFYGRLLPTTSYLTQEQLSRIEGTSGGPIISIERCPNDQVKYRLYGIQSAWLPDSRVLRAVGMSDVEAEMNNT